MDAHKNIQSRNALIQNLEDYDKKKTAQIETLEVGIVRPNRRVNLKFGSSRKGGNTRL